MKQFIANEVVMSVSEYTNKDIKKLQEIVDYEKDIKKTDKLIRLAEKANNSVDCEDYSEDEKETGDFANYAQQMQHQQIMSEEEFMMIVEASYITRMYFGRSSLKLHGLSSSKRIYW